MDLFTCEEMPRVNDTCRREADYFEYISRLLEEKNFQPLTETISLVDIKELETMKPKSRYDQRTFIIRNPHRLCRSQSVTQVVAPNEHVVRFLSKPKARSMSNIPAVLHFNRIKRSTSMPLAVDRQHTVTFANAILPKRVAVKCKSCSDIPSASSSCETNVHFHSVDNLNFDDESYHGLCESAAQLSKWNAFHQLNDLEEEDLSSVPTFRSIQSDELDFDVFDEKDAVSDVKLVEGDSPTSFTEQKCSTQLITNTPTICKKNKKSRKFVQTLRNVAKHIDTFFSVNKLCYFSLPLCQ